METLSNVFADFARFTGLEWYPDPAIVAKNDLHKQAVEKVDSIIAAQAESMAISHTGAQEKRNYKLFSQASSLYHEFRIWWNNIKK